MRVWRGGHPVIALPPLMRRIGERRCSVIDHFRGPIRLNTRPNHITVTTPLGLHSANGGSGIGPSPTASEARTSCSPSAIEDVADDRATPKTAPRHHGQQC